MKPFVLELDKKAIEIMDKGLDRVLDKALDKALDKELDKELNKELDNGRKGVGTTSWTRG